MPLGREPLAGTVPARRVPHSKGGSVPALAGLPVSGAPGQPAGACSAARQGLLQDGGPRAVSGGVVAGADGLWYEGRETVAKLNPKDKIGVCQTDTGKQRGS